MVAEFLFQFLSPDRSVCSYQDFIFFYLEHIKSNGMDFDSGFKLLFFNKFLNILFLF